MKGWGIVFLYTLLTYLSLPFTREWLRFFRKTLGSGFNLSINLFMLAVGLLIAIWVFKIATKMAFWVFMGLFALLLLLGSQIQISEERMHLLQYGLLGYLISSAIAPKVSLIARIGTLFLIGTAVALGDEIVQWALPSRVFDWWDVSYNLVGLTFGASIFHILK